MTFKEELMNILKEELDALKLIKKLTYEKTEIIINTEVEELEKVTKREEELINKMALAEEQRLNLLNTWGVDINTPFSKIIEKIPEEKDDLVETGEELNQLLVDIQSRNETNSELINENLQWLDFNMNLITQSETPTTYGNKNKGNNKNKKINRSLFDRKV